MIVHPRPPKLMQTSHPSSHKNKVDVEYSDVVKIAGHLCACNVKSD